MVSNLSIHSQKRIQTVQKTLIIVDAIRQIRKKHVLSFVKHKLCTLCGCDELRYLIVGASFGSYTK